MEDLLVSQSTIIDAIRKFGINLSKDGAERKSSQDYFKRKLDTLESYWKEFENNHVELSSYDIRDEPYYINGDYVRTMSLYKSIKESIIQQQEKMVVRSKIALGQPTIQAVPSEPSNAETSDYAAEQGQQSASTLSRQQISKGLCSKLDDMLRKQYINFKAFSRTVASIDLDEIEEKWEFEDKLKNLTSRWTTIDTLHWEIEAELDGEENSYQGVFLTHEDTFCRLKRQIFRKMWSNNHREQSTPILDIPTFAGQYNEWTSFKDLFSEAVHCNPTLSMAQKMQHLKTKLKGEALGLVRHLNVTTENYAVCWEILNNRYDNKKQIFTAHMNLLLSTPNVDRRSIAYYKKIHDAAIENLHALKTLGIDTEACGPMVVHLLSQKLDSETYTEYQKYAKNSREIPQLADFIDFLEFKFTTLESSQRKLDPQSSKASFSKVNYFNGKSKNYQHNQFYRSEPTNFNRKHAWKSAPQVLSGCGVKCPLCKQVDHLLYQCKNFINMSNDLKQKTVSDLNVCKNCLFDHNGKNCFSTKRCRNCRGKHHTILHDAYALMQPSTSSGIRVSEHVAGNTHVSQEDQSQVLLATALVRVTAANGVKHTMRALIDQGSQISLISENAAQLLGIQRRKCSGVIIGVGERENNSKGVINILCSSIYSDFSFNTDVIIMNSLIKDLPTQSFVKPNWPQLCGIQLADPEFNVSRRVDLLFGADIYSHIILSGFLKSENSPQPIVQQTQLGWILCGGLMPNSFHCNVVLNNIEDIRKFWEVEDIDDDSEMTSEDQECVQFYKSTTERQSDGRYVVRLPFKSAELHTLGSSKNIAMAQFCNLEKRLSKQNQLKQQYKDFISEYKKLGHMEEHYSPMETSIACYLPHHCVQKPGERNLNKFRVVFNASSKTSTGVSLNDVMLRGPNLQKDLQSLIIKWRQYPFVVTADIEKMYRQILVHKSDRKLQKIVWRDNPSEPIKSYELTTVTYGTKSAPFLAMMTLHQLAQDERTAFPAAAKILEEDLFMDDLLTGFYSVYEGKALVADINKLLLAGGFLLRKWSSNCQMLLEDLEEDQKRTNNQFNFKSEDTKTLGLSWNMTNDKFIFKHQLSEVTLPKLTKRVLLSEISKIFDPLGWLAPVVINLKVLFQNLWKTNLSWDEPVPNDILAEWTKLRADIDSIKYCELPRWIGSCKGDCIQLHGFCDASMRAYACVVYARVERQSQTTVVLVAAKTKVVPQSKSITLPKLELSGAQLLAKLMKKILQSICGNKIEVFGWCDSKVVIGWLQGDPGRWKPFVSNRIKLITPIMPPQCWSYVRSAENPADCASRGQLASQLRENTLWWKGPTWLLSFKHEPQEIFATDLELNKKIINVTQIKSAEPTIITELLNKYSTLRKTIFIAAWLLRALNINKKQLPSYITLQELRKAKLLIIKHVQYNEFYEDIQNLNKHKTVKMNSKLLNLDPYIDENGILRVGGRLRKSSLKIETKHPIILPHDCRFTTLLIEEVHLQSFHAGARLTTTRLRQKYWILGGIRAVKKQIRKCVICRKYNPQHQHQIMGTLPEQRITEAPPFFHTGVDLTGFIDVKSSRGRGVKTTKGYIVLFICMVTKAVHIELVSDLTSAAFLSAMKRMAARRGAPHHVYSDNATNFIKSNRNLQEEYFELQQIIDSNFLREITDMNIEWHFQAPSWPSASGLWERAIRSVKSHLKPVIGQQKLTFEEYTTLLAQIEACLNSRPLCPLTEDSEDLDILTPAHFLTGRGDLTIIETEKDARTRWQLVRKLLEDIWKRWKSEYLSQLNVRSKWFRRHPNISIGDIVCIHDEQLPPGKWSLGRVVEIHPGSDGIVRVVTLKTKNGYMKRPVLKLSVLPLEPRQPDKQIHPKVTASATKTSFKHTKKINIVSTLFSIILFMNICTSVQSKLHVNQFYQNQSLYLDKIANVRLIRDEWKLVVYYEMEPFWSGCYALNKYIKQLELTCSKLNDTPYCDVLPAQLRHGQSELQYYNKVLLNQHINTHTRQRRGLVNGVGYLSNYLFGVLDERFAEQYQRDIDQIHLNQNHLVNLWKNQTSIVEAEYNLLKRTEEAVSKQHDSIQKNIYTLTRTLNNVASESNRNNINNIFVLGALSASNMLNNLRGIQSMLINQVTDVYHGKFDFHLISPNQLLHELSIISSQLPSDLSLPIENVHDDLRDIYSLLKIKTRILEKYVMFEIRIPLTSRDPYELYELIAIPQRVREDSIAALIPKSKYMAINLRKETYLTITEHQINECLHRRTDTYLCYLQSPINQLRGDYDLCESADNTRTSCRLITAPCKTAWINLHNTNTYMYFCCHTCVARVHCGDTQVTSYQLVRAGIAVMTSDCMLKTDESFIYSHKLFRPDIVHVRPDIIAPDVPPINQLINISIPLLDMNDSDTENRKKALVKIESSLQQLKDHAEEDEISVHDIHHYTAIYVLLAIAAITGATLAWRRVRQRWNVPSPGNALVHSAAGPGGLSQPEGASNGNSASENLRCVSISADHCQCKSDIEMQCLRKQDRGTMPDRRQPVFTISESV